MELNEAHTRKNLTDKQLAVAGWSREQGNLLEELRLDSKLGQLAETLAIYQTSREFVDYTLLGRNGKPLAIVEAKRSSRDPEAGKRQALDYAQHIKEAFGFEPFIFLTNGVKTLFLDREPFPLREITGFFTLEDLEKRAFQRQYHDPLTVVNPDAIIISRDYQFQAVKQVTEALEHGQRKFLLVMATGTGKTRTALALIDLLIKAKWVRQVLFLADRRELVNQALASIKEYIPYETRAQIEGGKVDHAARIHVATYPSMMQVYQELSVGYYDLIVADESHRSIYNRYNDLFKYFDALQLGLTATPTDFIDHDTFQLFECTDGLPTFYYPYETAVRENQLVDYRVLESQTNFQIKGIKAGQLPVEFQQQLDAQGIDLEDIDFEGSDLEKRVTNTGTNDAIVREFMAKSRKDAAGTLPAKTIIFAMSHQHALEIEKSFARLYPDLQRRGLAEVIDSRMERVEKTLQDFKQRDMPHVAISVDMLDTGIDIPAIQNLVFAKPVFSQVKFWQMIGRGTRLWTDAQTSYKKKDFLIIDYWNNFAYFNLNPEGEIANPTEPLPVRLFRLRLEKLQVLQSLGQTNAANSAITQLQKMLEQLPPDNTNIRPHWLELQQLSEAAQWQHLGIEQLTHLSKTLAPLLRFWPEINLPTMLFEIRTEQLALAFLNQQTEEQAKLSEQIRQDLELLPLHLQAVQAHKSELQAALTPSFWQHLDYAAIMILQITFAPLMRYKQRQRQQIIQLNLPDEIANRRWIIYGPGGEGAFAGSYREKVEAQVKELAEKLPALHKLKTDQSLNETDLQSLEDALNRPDLFITPAVLREVYEQPNAGLPDLLRTILKPANLTNWDEQIKIAFDEFIASHPHFSSKQIIFVRTIRSAVLRRAKLSSQDLEQPPFNRVGAAQALFSPQELTEVLDFANKLIS